MKEKLTLKDLEKTLLKEPVESSEINGQKIIFNENLPLEKVFAVSESIANTVIKEDGTYLPKLTSILIFCFMIENTTNIEILKDKHGNLDIDFIYNLMCSESGKTLKNKFEASHVYCLLCGEVQEVLDYKKEIYFRKIPFKNSVTQNLDSLIFEIKNAAQKVLEFIDETGNLLSKNTLDKLSETLNKIHETNS